ncbi:MAG: hypothetical protein AB4911_07365 [Oscillochloridaceae bacterium umkhey_bin13]
MAVALLWRLLAAQGLNWSLSSAGVVGHDDAPAEAEARAAMAALGLDLTEHRARLLSDELIAEATLLIAIDTGIARVLRARYPQRQSFTLGELAGRNRDVPDPFRMQIGAWLQYANEIEALLRAGLPRLHQLLGPDLAHATPPSVTPSVVQPAEASGPIAPAQPVPPAAPALVATEQPNTLATRTALVTRACQILELLADLPALIVWPAARAQLQTDLAVLAQPMAPGDLAQPYVSLVQALFDLVATPPRPVQALALRDALARLATPIDPEAISALSATLSRIGREG